MKQPHVRPGVRPHACAGPRARPAWTAFVFRIAFVLAAIALLPGPAFAQSLLGFRALGVPVGTMSARAAAAGNLGVGLAGAEVSATDPTAAASLLFPTISASMQPAWGKFELGDENGVTTTTRFPVVGVGYPFPAAQGAVSFTLAGYMEQRWTGHVPRTTPVGDAEVVVDDRFESNGGTSVARIGWSQRIGDRLAAGLSAGTYLGRLDRTFDRTLDSATVGSGVESFGRTGSWTYSGPTVAAGVSADLHDLVHVAGALEWSGDLKADPRDDESGEAVSYDIPMRFSAGASGRLTPRIHLNASVVYQDWSDAAGFEPGTTATGRFSYGAGLEWQLVQGLQRALPVRLGYRNVVLPFRFGAADAVESIWSAGAGLDLVQAEGLRFGWIDAGIERSRRSSGRLSEQFWRATLSVGISRY